MLLNELLKSMNPESHICIGTEKGSNYLYFGTPSEALCMISKIFLNCQKSKYMTKCNEGSNSYIDPLNRVVVDYYYKEIDDCDAIIIQGQEPGRYWFEEEFSKKTKNKKPENQCSVHDIQKENLGYLKFNKGISDVEEYKRFHPDETFAYFCNGQKCNNGYVFCSTNKCFHTVDCAYAFNNEPMALYFYEVAPGKWMECTKAMVKAIIC